MDKNELWKLYYERDKEFEAAKGKRCILTISLFAVFYCVVLYVLGQPKDWGGIVWMLLISIILAGIHFWINVTIFSYLSMKGREEAEILERIKRQINELE